jgi:hypothetical protein
MRLTVTTGVPPVNASRVRRPSPRNESNGPLRRRGFLARPAGPFFLAGTSAVTRNFFLMRALSIIR